MKGRTVSDMSNLGGARRVLVVDDNADAAELAAELLRLFGHTVDVATDGPSALARVVDFHPEVVLLDLGMPGMSGYDVAIALRARDDTAGLRIVALTAWGDAASRARTAACGFDDHLTKPAELQSLLASLHAAVER